MEQLVGSPLSEYVGAYVIYKPQLHDQTRQAGLIWILLQTAFQTVDALGQLFQFVLNLLLPGS
ncbi:hypothetical protein H1Q63_20140 [Desmonostoc muscorum CCALA 125]|nr:hypothetical protein [Desmonostoc muscorum CCALA 125]